MTTPDSTDVIQGDEQSRDGHYRTRHDLPKQYTDSRDLIGNARSLSGGSLRVGESPVLIETSKVF